MTTPKKPRGRPKGDGINDSHTLEETARLIAANPKLKPTTAIKRVIHGPSDLEIHRLQVKWKDRGARLLARVLEAKPPGPSRPACNAGASNFALRLHAQQETLAAQVRQIVGGYDFGIMRAARELDDSLASRAMREASESLVLRATREVSGGVMARAMRAAQADTAGRAIRDAYESTSAKAMRDAYYGTASRALREAYESLGCGFARRGY